MMDLPRERSERQAASLHQVGGLSPRLADILSHAGYSSIEKLLRDNLVTISIRAHLNFNLVAEALSYCFLYVMFPAHEYERVMRRISAEGFVPDLVIMYRPKEFFAQLPSFFDQDFSGSDQDFSGRLRDYDRTLLERFEKFRRDFSELKLGLISAPDGLGDIDPDSIEKTRPRYQRVWRYRLLDNERDVAYSGLPSNDAIRIRGAGYFIPVAFSLAWLFWEAANRSVSLFVGIAGAATPESADFKPPLGLSQTTFSVIVCMFAALLFFLIIALAWKGYFAEKKSTKAATLVEHFGSLMLGVFFGTKL
jgi:hypothetical protein